MSPVNDSRIPDPRRDASDELAERIADDGLSVLEAADLLRETGWLGPAEESADERAQPSQGICIWRPETRDGEPIFVRPEPLPLGDHYATRRAIPARRPADTIRVAFFGESVATGYLYAPRLTCADVLSQYLEGADATFDVVDLARTNEQLGTLVQTVEASLQLNPDALVVFIGNNWNLLETPEVSPYRSDAESRRLVGRALQDGGLRAVEEMAQTRLRDRARSALARLADLAEQRPVVLVVPEVSLDWQSRQPPPWLPGDDTARWHELYRDAITALDEHRFEDAERAARDMKRLADGLGAIGGTASRLLGLALRGQLREPDAARALRDAIDQESYATMGLLGSPRATTNAQNLLRDAASRLRFELVDLPRIFDEHDSSEPFFLDYCHLTREGLRVAMQAVAASMTRALGLPVPVEHPAELCSAETEATALLGAAVHTAHRMTALGDKSKIVERWIRAAVDASPGVVQGLLDLVEHRTNPSPDLPTEVQARNLASPYRLGFQHGWRWPHLDADLLRAIRRVLSNLPEATSHLATFDRLVHRRALGPGLGQSVDLTQPPYLWEPIDQIFPEAMEDRPSRAFLRCPWPETSFAVITGAGSSIHLEVVARLPTIEGAIGPRTGELTIELDGRQVGRVTLGESWTQQELRFEINASGLHRLTLRWPPLPPVGDAAFDSAVRRLERGLEADLHPVFGELYSVSAQLS